MPVTVKVRRRTFNGPLFPWFTSPRICFDTEGTGLIPYGPIGYWGYHPARPFAFAFCDGDGNAAYFRWKVEPKTRRVIPGPNTDQRILYRLFTEPQFSIIGHNIAYDIRMVEAGNIQLKHHNVVDTMILGHVVTAGDELSYGLKPLSKKYLHYPDDDEKQLDALVASARRDAKTKGWLIAGGKKEVERGDHCVFAGSKPIKADYWLVPKPILYTPPHSVPDPEADDVDLVQRYAIGDVIRSQMLCQLWMPELKEEPRLRKTYEREMNLFWVLRRMERRGTRVYPDHTYKLIKWYERHMQKQRRIADRNGGEGMNFQSPKQLCKKFYIERGITPMYTERGLVKLELARIEREAGNTEEAVKLEALAARSMTLGKDKLAELCAPDPDTGKPKDTLAKAILEWRAAKQSIKSFLNIYAKFWYPEEIPNVKNPYALKASIVDDLAGFYDDDDNFVKWSDIFATGTWVLHPNYNQTGAVTGRMTCCIAHDTPIEIARDLSKHPEGIPVQDVRVGDWAYCVDERTGELHLRQVKRVWNRGTAHALIRIYWKGKVGKGRVRLGHVDVTPEHKIRTVNGQWIQAKELKLGQRITAIKREYPRKRARIAATGQLLQYESRFILTETVGAPTVSDAHAHHKNGNVLDNRPSNLEWKLAFKHWSDHSGGENNGRYIHWTLESITAILEKYQWSMTLACREEHMDYVCFRRHVAEFYDLSQVKSYRRRVSNHMVVQIEPLGIMRPVYDLWIDEHHNFFAGELSCKNSDPNLQQVASATTGLRKADIPARPRECFGPRPGCIWYLPDYSQMEVWVFAWLAKVSKMMELLLSGHDFHQGVADRSFVSRSDYEERKKYYRKLAKLIMFGKLYGGGVGTKEKPGRMTKLIQAPWEEAAEFVRSFDDQFVEVKAFMKREQRLASDSGEAWNLYGRKYKLERDWAYKVVNYLVQGSCADILKVATMRLDWMLTRRWPHPMLGLLNSIHDEFIIEVPYELHSQRLMHEIVYVMQMDSAMLGFPVPLPVGMKVAPKRWSHTKEVELPPWVKGGVPRDDRAFSSLRRDMQACPY